MQDSDGHATPSRFWLLFLPALLIIAAIATMQEFEPTHGKPVPSAEAAPSATYAHGILYLTIPYHAARAGVGRLNLEVLDPEDHVLAHLDQPVDVAQGQGRWWEGIQLAKPLAIDELVWHRLHYRFAYSDGKRCH